MERTHDKVWMSWITFGSTSCTRGGAGRTKVNRLHPKLHPNAAPIIFHRNFRVFSHIGYSFLRCIDGLNIRFFTFWMKLKMEQFLICYQMTFFSYPSSIFQPKTRFNQIWKMCVCKISKESHDDQRRYSWNVFEGESVKSNLCEKCVSEISDVSRAEYKWYSVSGPAPDHHTVPLWLMKQYGWRRISPSTPYKQCRNPFFKCSDKRKMTWFFCDFWWHMSLITGIHIPQWQ